MNLGGTIRLNPLGFCILVGSFLILLLYMTLGSGFVHDNNKQQSSTTSTVNLKSLLIAAVEVAEKGGSEVKATRLEADLQIKSKGETKEGVDDPVTNADFRSHCIMYHTLVDNFPKIKVISEEHPESKCANLGSLSLDVVGVVGSNLPDLMVPSEDVTVWIDPLDATKEFTENLVEYVTTMVCVAVKGKPIIGVIHRPFGSSKTFWAWVGHDVSQGLELASTDNTAKPDAPIIIVSRSHAGQVKNISEQAFGPDSKVVSAAGSGYKVLEVIKGNASIYLHTTAIKKWDVCAGNAILTAVGGTMTNLRGEELDYSSDTNPLNEKGILATVSDNHYYLDKIKMLKLL